MRIKTKGGEPVRRSLGLIGRIKIGEKGVSQSGKEYPQSLDYFRFDAPEMYARIAREKYGDKPTELPIVFYTDGDEGLSHFYELRDNAGKLIAYGDGQRYYVSSKDGMVLVAGEEVKRVVGPLKKQYTTDKYFPEWKEVLRMRFMLKDFPALGYWEFRSHGAGTSIPKLIGPYDLVQEHRGSVIGVDFQLQVVKHVGNTAGQARSYPLVSLYCSLNNGADTGLLTVGEQGMAKSLGIGQGDRGSLPPAEEGE